MTFSKVGLKLFKSRTFILLSGFLWLLLLGRSFRSKPLYSTGEYGPNDPYGPAYPKKPRPFKPDPRIQLTEVVSNDPLVPVEIPTTDPALRANAAFVILCRNSDLEAIVETLRQFEESFNSRYRYPYVFLNNVPFSFKFREAVRNVTSGKVEFGEVGREEWRYPGWINQGKAEECMEKMEKGGVIYGGSLSYRHMCRFYSGFFFRHPLVRKYDWYWRIEPGVSFFCTILYDPFVYMEQNNKKYGFTINLLEVPETIPSLWQTTKEYVEIMGIRRNQTRLLKFFADEHGGYNGCHFWSNFEIARRDLWDNPAYLSYFNHLDRAGGFYYERWGDAPIHTLALASVLGLNKSQIHFFNDIGYKHEAVAHCVDHVGALKETCKCRGERNFDRDSASCLRKWVMYAETEWTFGDAV
ncbi:alpha 1,2-mannosyltransferase 2.4.1 [Rhizophlyctis rosea]|nr:alpha 1,2-mannosyltransferase 2.4.1 [Rhizophlyctis rosea]